jgi:hypothetical protein
MLPDELEHEKFVEVRVEQGARDGIHLPVVIVRAAGQIDNHVKVSLQFLVHSSQLFGGSIRTIRAGTANCLPVYTGAVLAMELSKMSRKARSGDEKLQ